MSAALFAKKRDPAPSVKENDLLTCWDLQVRADKVASVHVPDGATRLNQSCDSLGRTELTRCTKPNLVEHYYHVRYSDKFMADCVKEGGRWETNQSPEADVTRAKQETPR